MSAREKVILQKFISAEDERNCKKKIKEELARKKQENFIKFQLNTKKIGELHERLVEEYNKNKQKEVLRTVKQKTNKLHDSIMLHRKVIKGLIEQESKIIRKPKRCVSKIDKLPYLRKVKQKLIDSMQISASESESEEKEVDFSIAKLIIPFSMNSLKLKSSTPIPAKPKVHPHLVLKPKPFPKP